MRTEQENTNQTNEENDVTDKKVFDTFFHENCCPLEYNDVRNDFEEAAADVDGLFVDDCDFFQLNSKNFILYMTSEAYCTFEAIVEENFEALNPEIADAVMDISVSTDHPDEITEQYWTTCENLLRDFLQQLFREKIEPMQHER